MWVWVVFSIILILLGLLIRQRWKVTAEWLRMESELSEEEYAIWKRQKERESEEWNDRMKNFEAGFILLLTISLLAMWFLI